jgi:site-specific DNA-cytosine methylase
MKTQTNLPHNPNEISVLSLFDGLSAARISLDLAGIKVKDYYSSEICKNAIKLQNFHYSADTTFHQIGDVRTIKGNDYAHISLIIGGFPCRNLTSLNGKDRSGVSGDGESALFYEFIRIIKEIRQAKPKGEKLYLLVENVRSMKSSQKEIITKAICEAMNEDIQPVMICNSICAGSIRRRLFWSNIELNLPKETHTTYQSCVENGFVNQPKANVILGSQLTNCGGLFRYINRKIGNVIFKLEEYTQLSKSDMFARYSDTLRKSGHTGKSRSITDEYSFANNFYRIPSIKECSRLLSIPDDYVESVPNVSKTSKYKMLGLSFSPCVVSSLLSPLKNQFTNE